MKELLKTILRDFHLSLPRLNVMPRDLQVPMRSGKIVSLIGPRRCGKTYYFYHLINQMLSGVAKEQIIYINFEDERLELTSEKLHLIVDAYSELYPENMQKPLFFLFDEIQQIPGWERFVRRVYDTISKDIYITGSSAKLLDRELASSLRGRHIVYRLYPLSFKEYCFFKQVDASDLYATASKGLLSREFDRYVQFGGYPEIIAMEPELAQKALQSYFEVMLFRDIIERHRVTNVVALKQFLKKVFSNIANPFSVNKFFNELKSQGVAVSKNDVYQFLDYAADSLLIYTVNHYDSFMVKQQMASKKLYAVDTGLVNAITFRYSHDRGYLLENAVFVQLKRATENVFFLKNKVECDFCTQAKDATQVMQVCYSLQDSDARRRELNGLLNAMNRFGLQEGTILTWGEEETITVGSKIVEIKPAWKAFLQMESGDRKEGQRIDR